MNARRRLFSCWRPRPILRRPAGMYNAHPRLTCHLRPRNRPPACHIRRRRARLSACSPLLLIRSMFAGAFADAAPRCVLISARYAPPYYALMSAAHADRSIPRDKTDLFFAERCLFWRCHAHAELLFEVAACLAMPFDADAAGDDGAICS